MGNIFQKQQPIICPRPPPCPVCNDCPESTDCPECTGSMDSETILKNLFMKYGDLIDDHYDTRQNGCEKEGGCVKTDPDINKIAKFNTDEGKQEAINEIERYIRSKGGNDNIFIKGLWVDMYEKAFGKNIIKNHSARIKNVSMDDRIENVDQRVPREKQIINKKKFKKLTSGQCRDIEIRGGILGPVSYLKKIQCYGETDGKQDGDILGRKCPRIQPFTKPMPLPFLRGPWKKEKSAFDMNQLKNRIHCLDKQFDNYVNSNNINASIENVVPIDRIEPFENENYDIFIYIIILIILVYIFCKK
jgi:hypothetical protein